MSIAEAAAVLRAAGWTVTPPTCYACKGTGRVQSLWTSTDGKTGGLRSEPCPRGCGTHKPEVAAGAPMTMAVAEQPGLTSRFIAANR